MLFTAISLARTIANYDMKFENCVKQNETQQTTILNLKHHTKIHNLKQHTFYISPSKFSFVVAVDNSYSVSLTVYDVIAALAVNMHLD